MAPAAIPAMAVGSVTRPTYPPNILETEHGTVTVSPARPHQGDRVTITTQPDEGYKLGEITVTRPNGQKVTLTPRRGWEVHLHPARRQSDHRCDLCPREMALCGRGGKRLVLPSREVRSLSVASWWAPATPRLSPQSSVTRGQVVQMLYNLEGQPTVTGGGTALPTSNPRIGGTTPWCGASQNEGGVRLWRRHVPAEAEHLPPGVCPDAL